MTAPLTIGSCRPLHEVGTVYLPRCPWCDSRDSGWSGRWLVCGRCGCSWQLGRALTAGLQAVAS